MIQSKIQVSCSFCKKFQTEVKALIKADKIFICNECVALCSDMVKKFESEKNYSLHTKILYPKQIREKLDEEIIGQAHAKEVLSVAAFMHTLRIKTCSGSKSNILLIGPTGCGKTKMIEVLSQIMELPLAIADATTLTETGYVGDDVESILSKLIQAANGNIELAEKGIVYLDEIDKIARTSENKSISRDVSGEGVQQALLKIIEGTKALVPQKYNIKHPNQDMVQINTENILFICGGAFEGIDKIIKKRIHTGRMGICSNGREINQTQEAIDTRDLIKFGLIPELVGRLPIRVLFHALELEDYIRIIVEPKSSIFNQYRSILSNINKSLNITDEAIQKIAQESIKHKTGARSIKSVFEAVLLPMLYSIQDENEMIINITEDMISPSETKVG